MKSPWATPNDPRITGHAPEPNVASVSDYVRKLETDLDSAGQELHRLDETIFDLGVKLAKARDVLYQIAAPKRPDGTYNLSREACERLAAKVLEDEYGL